MEVTSSLFHHLDSIPLDPHYALKEQFQADKNPQKVILGSGVYRDDGSKPWVLPAVEKAEQAVDTMKDSARYEYLPIQGYSPFYKAARSLLLGPLAEDLDHVVSIHTISGTGANHLGARFLSESLKPSCVWISDPSWVNHADIWGLVGVQVKYYPYWNPNSRALDFEKMIAKLEADAAPRDVIVLHACAHNPTGVDPTREQWKRIADVCQKLSLFPFFDCAYQGFATGNLDDDAWAVRHFFERETMEMAVAQSFSKNMGLYGERVGALHLITGSNDSAAKAGGYLNRLQRGEISQPPTRGAKLATQVLTDPELFQAWLRDLKEMSSRIRTMRQGLYNELVVLGTPGSWDHIVSQIGMFSYTGLTSEQVDKLRNDFHVYILKSGRISVAGLNTVNVKYVAQAIDIVARSNVS